MKSNFKWPLSKTPQYQDIRNKSRSELNCSELLSDINEVQEKMKQYQELRKSKKTLSEQNILRTSLHKENRDLVTTRAANRYENKTDRLLLSASTNLEIIEEHNPRLGNNKQLISSGSCTIFPKNNKALLAKTVNVNSKDKDTKEQKKNCLRLKTKQLQQEILDTFSGDPSKKNNINREFAALFKLLQ